MRQTLIKVSLILSLIVGLTACATTPEQPSAPVYDEVYTRVSEATIKAGDAVPAPEGDVILTLTGNLGTTNVDNTLQFDIETLEQLGVVEYSVNDHQAEGKVVTFQGVLLRDLLAVAGIPEGTETLVMTALNDYRIDFPVSDVSAYPVVLATKVDGERMTVERYGPTRIVYPADTYNLDPAIFDSRWIWQLATIEVQ